MSRILLTGLLASAAVMPACVADHGDESYVILGNLAGETDDMGVTTFTADLQGPFISSGVALLSLPIPPTSAGVGSLVESRIDAPEGKESERTIFVSGANISATVSPVLVDNGGGSITEVGAAEVLEYQISFGAIVRPNQGLSAVLYNVIPPEVFAGLAARVNGAGGNAFLTVDTTTTLIGEYYGERLDSLPFNFPIVISNATLP